MTQSNFKKNLQSHFNNKSLSNTQLKKLENLQQQYEPANKRNLSFNWTIAASLFFAAVTAGILFINLPSDIRQLIGDEVATNHIKLKPLEIKTADIKDIRQYFTELDFNPVESSSLTINNQSLIGGRYCSIQGIAAAQLRFKNTSSGEIQSLYQTIYDKRKFKSLPDLTAGNKPVTVYAKGLAIDIWVEKDILFALTREEK